jgi:MFS family permease
VKNRTALLAALGVDNFGSGLFLPLSLVYVTRVIGLSLGAAGTLVALGTLAGLAIPPIAGRLVDRVGPKSVIIAAQLLQALGALAYLAAHSAIAVLAAAMLLAAGQQMFYSSLAALISDVAGAGPHDRPFAVANMVRSGCFGLGGLAVAGILTAAGPVALRIALVADAGSFVTCSLLLALFVRLPKWRADGHAGLVQAAAFPDAWGTAQDVAGDAGAARAGARRAVPGRVTADGPFLALITVSGLVVLAIDFFLTGMPVYVLEQLHAPP